MPITSYYQYGLLKYELLYFNLPYNMTEFNLFELYKMAVTCNTIGISIFCFSSISNWLSIFSRISKLKLIIMTYLIIIDQYSVRYYQTKAINDYYVKNLLSGLKI